MCVCMRARVCAQLSLTLRDPVDCSLPASSVHAVFQARIQEWVAMPFSRGSSKLREWAYLLCPLHWQVYSLLLQHQNDKISTDWL